MSEINSQALREAAEKAGEDKWQAKKIMVIFSLFVTVVIQDSMATHRINPLRRLIVSQSGILLPRLIRLPCWNYWMHWKQQKSALQNWKRGKYCSRNVAACFIEQIFTMITKR